MLATFDESVICEAFKIKIDSTGNKTKRKIAADGFKIVDGRQVKMSSEEKMRRKRGAKRGSKKRVRKQATINRKTKKALKIRQNRGM